PASPGVEAGLEAGSLTWALQRQVDTARRNSALGGASVEARQWWGVNRACAEDRSSTCPPFHAVATERTRQIYRPAFAETVYTYQESLKTTDESVRKAVEDALTGKY